MRDQHRTRGEVLAVAELDSDRSCAACAVQGAMPAAFPLVGGRLALQ